MNYITVVGSNNRYLAPMPREDRDGFDSEDEETGSENVPDFKVDLTPYQPAIKLDSRESKVSRVARAVFSSMGYIGVAASKALYEGIRYAPLSFRHIVIGYYNPGCNPTLIAFKVAIWALAVGFNILVTTARLWANHTFPTNKEQSLRLYTDSEINIEHIRTDEAALDTSKIPFSVKVNDLETFFAAINFDDPNDLAYMAPTSLKEGAKVYTQDEAQKNLKEFIRRVNNREAFLGTPPSYDTPRLMAFYGQIEDAVRISIHTHNERIGAFQAKYGTDIATYDEEAKKLYKNLLEDRARVAIDLSIAGAHCGARYMGDAMTVYSNTVGDAADSEKDFKGTFIELLARKRKSIAEAHIQKHVGTDTHDYANYMSNLGGVLGIPGTKNIIEHLAHPLDADKYKRLFFGEYTPALIIQTIQEKVQASQEFREKIVDWAKGQIGDWSPLDETKANQLKEELQQGIEAIAKEEIVREKTPLDNFCTLLEHLNSQNMPLPSFDKGWDSFIDDLFGINAVKGWCSANLQSKQANVAFHSFKRALKENETGADLVKQLQPQISQKAFFGRELVPEGKDKRIAEVSALFNNKNMTPPSLDTIERMLQGKLTVKDMVENAYDKKREEVFIHSLHLEGMKEKGLPLVVLEWMLVSQGILRPQIIAPSNGVPIRSDDDFMKLILDLFKVHNRHIVSDVSLFMRDLLDPSADSVALEQRAKALLEKLESTSSSMRYFEGSYVEKLLRTILAELFKKDPSAVIKAVNIHYEQSLSRKLKEEVCVNLIQGAGQTIDFPLVKLVASIFVIVRGYNVGCVAYDKTHDLMTKKIIPYCVENAPMNSVKAFHIFKNVVYTIYEYRLLILLGAFLIQQAGRILPEIPYISGLIRRISIRGIYNRLFSHETIFGAVINCAFVGATFTWRILSYIGRSLKSLSSEMKSELSGASKAKADAAWSRLVGARVKVLRPSEVTLASAF